MTRDFWQSKAVVFHTSLDDHSQISGPFESFRILLGHIERISFEDSVQENLVWEDNFREARDIHHFHR